MSAPSFTPVAATRDPIIEAFRIGAPIDVSVIESAIRVRFEWMDDVYAQIGALERQRKRIYDEVRTPYAPLEHA